MKISVIDLCGYALGVSIGLKELGHDVAYMPAQRLEPGEKSLLEQCRDELIQAVFGKAFQEPETDADLVVICDGFGDQIWAGKEKIQLQAPMNIKRPLAATINPAIYPARLNFLAGLASSSKKVVIIDGSDRFNYREKLFESIPGACLLAREVPVSGEKGPWKPFPYIYHMLILFLEKCRERAGWFAPFENRKTVYDWSFCGTVKHPRYGGTREAMLAQIQGKWPSLRTYVCPEGSSFVDILKIIQCSLWGLDMPGGGELCFRIHEYLSLGIPIFRPWPWKVEIPEAVRNICYASPDRKNRPSGRMVLDAYEKGYRPRVAAERLLTLAGQGR